MSSNVQELDCVVPVTLGHLCYGNSSNTREPNKRLTLCRLINVLSHHATIRIRAPCFPRIQPYSVNYRPSPNTLNDSRPYSVSLTCFHSCRFDSFRFLSIRFVPSRLVSLCSSRCVSFLFVSFDSVCSVSFRSIASLQHARKRKTHFYLVFVCFQSYTNSNEADLAPESGVIISAEDSPSGKALLIAAYEDSNTLAVFEISTD